MIEFKKFLESSSISNGFTEIKSIWQLSYHRAPELSRPDLSLYCDKQPCNQKQIFAYHQSTRIESFGKCFAYLLRYVCKNCGEGSYIFFIDTFFDKEPFSGKARKVSVFTPIREPIPTRAKKLLGQSDSQRDLFFKGLACERNGHGIGAFGYYRRVVENQRTEIFKQVISVAQKVGVPSSQIELLKKASVDWQFESSVGAIKDLIPDQLLVGNENPLLLLHSALSGGIHSLSDDECLERAKHIKIILFALAEKIGEVLAENKELEDAIKQLRQ